jgi:hypothetical protein
MLWDLAKVLGAVVAVAAVAFVVLSLLHWGEPPESE